MILKLHNLSMKLCNRANALLLAMQLSVRRTGTQHYAFSIFAMLNYVAPLFMSRIHDTLSVQLIFLRVIAVMLCLGICVVAYWQAGARSKYFPIYWYLTLWYCLPFLSTYTALLTNADEYWVLNAALSFLLLILLVNWLIFSILIVTGICFAYIIYIAIGYGNRPLLLPANDIYLFAYLCAFTLLASVVFMRKKENAYNEKLEAMKVFGGAVAHEVNSPLAVVQMLSTTMGEIVKDIVHTAVCDETGSYTIKMNEVDYKMLVDTIPNGLIKSSEDGVKIISMLLLFLKDKFLSEENYYSMAETIDEAIADFPCIRNGKLNVHLNKNNDFLFFGSKQLIKHIIYNLLQNAMKHGKANAIEVWMEGKTLYLMDNGDGLSDRELCQIFKPFYTSSATGVGIGLAFSSAVMKTMGGSMDCESKEGEYAKFIMTFP